MSVLRLAPPKSRKNRYREDNPKLTRNGNYREKYFAGNRGYSFAGFGNIYICPYCGKLMRDRKRITVDHIYSVRAVQRNRKLRERFGALPDGVNDMSNLVACCRTCNSRKGTKAGFWVPLGRYGHRFMTGVRLAVYALLLFAAAWGIINLLAAFR